MNLLLWFKIKFLFIKTFSLLSPGLQVNSLDSNREQSVGFRKLKRIFSPHLAFLPINTFFKRKITRPIFPASLILDLMCPACLTSSFHSWLPFFLDESLLQSMCGCAWGSSRHAMSSSSMQIQWWICGPALNFASCAPCTGSEVRGWTAAH